MRFFYSLLFLVLAFGCTRHSPEDPLLPTHSASFMTVVVDPGHGGKDEGCVSEPFSEKELTLKTAVRLKEHLQKLGYRVVMTRNRDVFIPLDQRADLANDLDSHIFVSVHFNCAENKKAKGIEVFYFDDESNLKRKERSKKLAKLTLDKVIAFTETKSRGVKTGDYRVIKKTVMPAILVEGGFLSNSEENKKCQDPVYQDALAWGIARGIDDFVKADR